MTARIVRIRGGLSLQVTGARRWRSRTGWHVPVRPVLRKVRMPFVHGRSPIHQSDQAQYQRAGAHREQRSDEIVFVKLCKWVVMV